MEFEHAAIALLASMILVLAGVVGWLYWQQTRMFQSMNNIVMVVGELASAHPQPEPVGELETTEETAPIQSDTEAEADAEAEDDRVSVDNAEPVVIEGPPDDADDFDGKTKKELQEILTKRGIPFGKADTKTVLLTLLKATA